MPNNPSREAFERWLKKSKTPKYMRDTEMGRDQLYAIWQAGAQAERDRISAEHASKVPHAEMEKLQAAVKVLRDRSAP